jgi:hypothetical protein
LGRGDAGMPLRGTGKDVDGVKEACLFACGYACCCGEFSERARTREGRAEV